MAGLKIRSPYKDFSEAELKERGSELIGKNRREIENGKTDIYYVRPESIQKRREVCSYLNGGAVGLGVGVGLATNSTMWTILMLVGTFSEIYNSNSSRYVGLLGRFYEMGEVKKYKKIFNQLNQEPEAGKSSGQNYRPVLAE